MAPSTDTDVLLETVAVYPYQSSKSSQTGYFQERGHLDIAQPQRAMAFVPEPGAVQAGMTNKWLSEQGLISVKEQWVKIHYPATGPVILMNRPMRTRLWGGVGAGGLKPPATRLFLLQNNVGTLRLKFP